MRSIFLMTWKNIKRKKLQNILIFMIIFLASLMFSTSLVMLEGIKEPLAKTHKELNGFDECIFLYPSKDKSITKFFKDRKEVREISISKCCAGIIDPSLNNKKIPVYFNVQEKENKDIGIDKLKILEGIQTKSPKDGEAWIPSAYAKKFNIKIGDILSFNIEKQKVNLRISGIVVDPEFNSINFGVARLWVNKGYLEKNVVEQNVQEAISLKLYDSKEGNKIWNDFNEHFKNIVTPLRFQYEEFVLSYNAVNNILGAILFILSMLIVLFTTIVIAFTISNMFFADYKIIGVIEALGFKKIEILFIYLLQFLLLSSVSAPIGIFFSRGISKLLLSESFIALGFGEFNPNIAQVGLISFFIVVSIIVAATLITSLKTLKVNPVEAIRLGSLPSKGSKKSSLSLVRLKKFPLSLCIALKNIAANKRETAVMFILMFLCFYITIFSLNINKSMDMIGDNSSYWGFEKCDVSIKAKDNASQDRFDKIIKIIEQDSRVQTVAMSNSYTKAGIGKYKDMPARNFFIPIYDKPLGELGLENLRGRNPENEGEVSIAINTCKNYGKDIGDYITLYINGQEKKFLVTGVYQIMNNLGYGFRIQYDELKKIDPSFEIDVSKQASISLKDFSYRESFMKDIIKNYGREFEVVKGNIYLKDIASSSTSIINKVCLGITISFFIAAFVCIFNFILIGIYQNKKSLGIFKALGVDDRTLILSNIIRVILTSLAGFITAFPIIKATASSIMGKALSSYGVQKFPLISNDIGLAIAVPLILVLVTLASTIPSSSMLNINSKELISE